MALPEIIEERGNLAFVCPCCTGMGATRSVYWASAGVREKEITEACKHCFGFGRLPCPSWFKRDGAR